MNKEIQTKVYEILASSLNVDIKEINDEKTMSDLGADSLDAVSAIMDVEKGFDLHFLDSETETIRTVGELVTLTESYLSRG